MKITTLDNAVGTISRIVGSALLIAGVFGPYTAAFVFPDKVAKFREGLMVENSEWEPKVSIHGDRTEVDFRRNSCFNGQILIDDCSDGTVDRKIAYLTPFRGIGGPDYNAEVTAADQKRYEEVMDQ